MKKLLPLLIIFLLIFTSCNTMLDDRSGEVPSWYVRTPSRRGYVTFSAVGRGSTVRAARQAAITALLDDVSAYLGHDVTGRYFRELDTFSRVEELSLEIRDEAEVTDSYYILAQAPEETLESLRSDEFKAVLAREEQIGTLISQAEERYRENEDIDALRLMLEAIRISASGDIFTPEYEYQVLLQRAMRWMGQLDIRVSQVDAESGSARVRVYRNRGVLSPYVSNAGIAASVPVYLTDGSISTFVIPLESGDDGYIRFTRFYPMQCRKGSVRFSLDLEDEILLVETILGPEAMSEFRRLYEAVTSAFDYEIAPGQMEIICVMGEYDAFGDELSSTYLSDAVVSYFESEGIALTLYSSDEDDLDAMYDLVKEAFPTADYLLWGRSGITEERTVGNGRTLYTCGGYVLLSDLSTETLIATDELARSAVWEGESFDESMKQLFTTYGNAIAAYFIQFL